ncbi:membrane protein [Rubrobacter xylanophilus]|uniref:Membrane protein n=2 Tax=Rubrobacter xylanophilus TaxID=49319 RepID=A0A510HKD2_9ACTN|nr:membrane protein [Rubrobacter xylanophilus]
MLFGMAGGKGRREGRFWDVDAARGVAMIMVAFYHLVFDLDNFGGYPIASTSGFWAAFADASAFMFVFLAGLSLTLSHRRAARPTFGKYLGRGMRIFAYGMLITLVFRLLDYGYVIFGILHLIGVSIVLAYPFLRLRWANLVLGLLIIAFGAYVGAKDFVVGGAAGVLLAPLGVLPEGLMMPDYRPLLPWFGVVLFGVFCGNAVYLPWRERHRAGEPPGRVVSALALIGRNTLFIYLVHQPVLIAALWALGIISLSF